MKIRQFIRRLMIRRLIKKFGLPSHPAVVITEHGTATVKPWAKSEIERLFAGKN